MVEYLFLALFVKVFPKDPSSISQLGFLELLTNLKFQFSRPIGEGLGICVFNQCSPHF